MAARLTKRRVTRTTRTSESRVSMRKLFGFVAVAAQAVSGQAQAAAMPFTGSLSVQIATLPPFTALGGATAALNGSGALGHLNTISLPGGTFAPAGSVPVDSTFFPTVGVKVNAKNGAGSFSGAVLGGQMPVIGTSTVCIGGGPGCTINAFNVNIPFTSGGVDGVGLGGAPIVQTFLTNVTVRGAAWTTGTVTTITALGAAVWLSGLHPRSGLRWCVVGGCGLGRGAARNTGADQHEHSANCSPAVVRNLRAALRAGAGHPAARRVGRGRS